MDVSRALLTILQGQLGKESKQASDPALGSALWELSHKIIQEKLGKDALIPWDSNET
jgi:hypothetical protein